MISCENPEEFPRTLNDIPANRILTVDAVRKLYSEDPLSGVKKASFTINKGDIVAIIGESGSGKSTLLKLLYGLMTPDEGAVFFKHEEVRGPEKKLIPGHDSMKMVTQDFSLNTYAKVYDNIASMLPNTNLKYKADKTNEMLDLLRITHLGQKRVSDLSGGEQQRVAIAKSIVTEPEILLMDEPFSQLDAMLKTQLRSDIRNLARKLNITIVMVSHDPIDGLTLADQLVVMRRGEIVETGTPRQLYKSPTTLYTARLLADCNVLAANQAALVGISATGNIVIYTEDIQLKNEAPVIGFKVKEIYFRGFIEEMLIEKEGVQLKILNNQPGKYQIGDDCAFVINKFLEFEEI